MSKLPVIIDCDPGHDDVIAITLALSSDKLDVRGIVTVMGNNTLDNVTKNALKALELLGRTDVPVIKGAVKPMRKEHVSAKGHGSTGLDGPDLPEPTTPVVDKNFVDYYYEVLSAASEPMTIIALGPLTNIATLLFCHPEVKDKIKEIAYMGGANLACDFKEFSTYSRTAEFNVWQDAESASYVFDAGIPITMFGLDLTMKNGVTFDEVEKFRTEGGRVGNVVAQLLDFYFKAHTKVGLSLCPIHDACPVAWLIDPTLFSVEHRDISVDFEGDHTYGCTYVDMRFHKEPTKPTYWASDCTDRSRFVQMLLDACKSYQ